MPKFFTIAFICLNALVSGQVNWQIKNPFEQKNFIENKGQFEMPKPLSEKEILFSASIDGVDYFFTKQSYVIKYTKRVERDKKEKSNQKEEKESELFKYKVVDQFYEVKFINAASDLNIIPLNKVSHYYCYADLKSLGQKNTLTANAYEKLVYKNIYPFIDLIFEFPKDTCGIKYSFILQPGADPNQIKIQLPGGLKKVLNKKGDLLIHSEFGKITEHAPVTKTESGKLVNSSFVLTNGNIGFTLGDFPNDQQIIIDPWIVTPNFASNPKKAFDVDYDNFGNVYVYGGSGLSATNLLKYNSSGILLWSYLCNLFMPYEPNGGYYYGDFTIDQNTSSIYLIQGLNMNGAKVIKLNSSGILTSIFNGNILFQEMWRIAYNACTKQTVIAGGGPSIPTYQTCYLDSALTNLTPVQYIPGEECCHDINMLAIDNYGACYQVSNSSVGGPLYNNQLIKLPLPNLSPAYYNVNTGYSIGEIYSNQFYNYFENGYNGISTSKTNVYTYDGHALKKWQGNNGSLLFYKKINNPLDSSLIYWGGLSSDDCDNIFLGDNTVLKQLDDKFNLVKSTVMPAEIYDVKLGRGNKLYVCGNKFLAALTVSISNCSEMNVSITKTVTNASCKSNGMVSLTINGNNPPYSASWNTTPPQSGLSLSNLTPGIYTAVITDNSCNKNYKVDSIIILPPAESFTANGESTNSACLGKNNGSAFVHVNGVGPFNYSWSNGHTGSDSSTNLAPGNYSVNISNAAGCKDTVYFKITEPTKIVDSLNISASYCSTETEARLKLNSENVYGPYQWYTNGNAVMGANSSNYLVPVDDISTYSLTWYYNGCRYKTAIILDNIIPVVDISKIKITNIFTPNGDGVNDIFYPISPLEYPYVYNTSDNYELTIFDRWGKKVFETRDKAQGWTGKNLQNNNSDESVFFWILKFKSACASEKGFNTLKGNVTLTK